MDDRSPLVVLTDSMQNLVTNMGTESDKSTYSHFVERRITERELIALYRFGGIGGKIVDIVPDDETRQWRTVTIPAPIEREPFDDFEKILQVKETLAEARRWARLFGGSVILIEVEGDAPREPLVEASISRNKPITALHVRTRHDIAPASLDLRTMRPEEYRDFRGTGDTYHPSRVLGPFDGIPLPRRELERNYGWGGSVIERAIDALIAEGETAGQISPLVHEALVQYVGVKNLAQYLKNDEEQRRFEKRWALGKFLASVHNVYIYDSIEEVIGEKSSMAAVTGLADLLEKNANRVASIVDIPMTRLFGQVTGGLNTSASTNLKDYYNAISSSQKKMEAVLTKLDRLMLRSVYGTVPAGYWYEWVPLDEPTSKERSETDRARAETDRTLYEVGAILPAHIARRIQKDGPYELSDEYCEALEERDGLREGKALTFAAGTGVEPGTPSTPAGGEVQKQALNGAQITSLVEIGAKVRVGELSPEQAVAIILVSIPSLSPEEARSIAGTPAPKAEVPTPAPVPIPPKAPAPEPPEEPDAGR